MAEAKLTKGEVRNAMVYFASEGIKIPGINKLRAHIGHGSIDRIRRLRDELLEEGGVSKPPSKDLPDPISQLSESLWEEMNEQLEEFKADLQADADEKIADYKNQLEAERAEKDGLSDTSKKLASALEAAQDEIERLNRLIVDKDIELTQRNTQLAGRDDQIAQMQGQFNDFKAMNIEYGKEAAAREKDLNAELRSKDQQMAALNNEKHQSAVEHAAALNQLLEDHQAAIETLQETLNRVYENTIDQNTTGDATQQAIGQVIEQLTRHDSASKDQFDDVKQLINRLNRGVMENVLLLPEINKATQAGAKQAAVDGKLEALSAVIEKIQKGTKKK